MQSTIARSQPIVSLSLNPAIDLNYEVTAITHDQKSRASKTYYDPGGTGINVGKALQILKANCKTCYITAGKMGEFLDGMIQQELTDTYSLRVEGETRINTTILQSSPFRQYEINATGPHISPHQIEQIVDQFLTFCQQGIGILTGSLPPGLPKDTYNKINLLMQQQGARCIIDAPIDILRHTLDSQPFLIKPNLHELETLQNKSLSSVEQIAAEARQLIQRGCHLVCVSLGEKGAILSTVENSFFCNAPDITTHSTVGAGDSMVAALAYAHIQQQSPQNALTLAVACGTATAKQPGSQLFKLADLEILKPQIKIKTLDI
jgi:6-phosphofructokinase 2